MSIHVHLGLAPSAASTTVPRRLAITPLATSLEQWSHRCAVAAVDLFATGADDETAIPNRSAQFWLNWYGFWPDPSEDVKRTAWVKGASDAMSPYAMSGQYVNFLGHDASDPREKALAAYGRAKLERLMALERRYDPENLFRINHNIPPAPST